MAGRIIIRENKLSLRFLLLLCLSALLALRLDTRVLQKCSKILQNLKIKLKSQKRKKTHFSNFEVVVSGVLWCFWMFLDVFWCWLVLFYRVCIFGISTIEHHSSLTFFISMCSLPWALHKHEVSINPPGDFRGAWTGEGHFRLCKWAENELKMSWKVLSESDPFDRESTLCTQAEYRIKTNEKYLFSKKKLKFVEIGGYSVCVLVFYFSHLVIPYCWKYSFSMKALSGHFRTALIVPRKWYLVKREIKKSFISFDNGWKKVICSRFCAFSTLLRFFHAFALFSYLQSSLY